MRTERIGNATLYLGDCLTVLPTLGQFDAVITDPPYPDALVDTYKQTNIAFLNNLLCWQIVFWSARAEFPLSSCAVHIWDKGTGFEYERIFERGGGTQYFVYRHYLINSTMAARYTRDEFTGHPSQKPVALILEICKRRSFSVALDPFMGSGTTGVAAIRMGRAFIGIEIEPKYFDMACERIENAQRQERLFA